MFIDFLKSIDWGGIAVALFLWILPILATVATRYVIILTRSEIENIKATQPNLFTYLEVAAKWATDAVEQMKKRGEIKDSDFDALRDKAVEIVKLYLAARGFDAKLVDESITLIVSAVEREVGKAHLKN